MENREVGSFPDLSRQFPTSLSSLPVVLRLEIVPVRSYLTPNSWFGISIPEPFDGLKNSGPRILITSKRLKVSTIHTDQRLLSFGSDVFAHAVRPSWLVEGVRLGCRRSSTLQDRPRMP